MRPKKRVLLVDQQEVAASVRKLALHVHGYYVAVTPGTAEAMELIRKEPEFDVVVCRIETRGALRLLKTAQRCSPGTPVLLFSDGARRREGMPFAGGCTVWGNLDTEQLLQAVKALEQRSAGPRPKPVKRALPPQMWERREA